MSRMISLSDFLTEDEIIQCIQKYRIDKIGFHEWCVESLILPNIMRINAQLGYQQNDPSYLAYLVEFVMSHIYP